jgi:hypothetical protein
VARGFAGYLESIILGFGGNFPTWLTSYPLSSIFDLNFLAGLGVLVISVALFAGVEKSALANHVCFFFLFF